MTSNKQPKHTLRLSRTHHISRILFHILEKERMMLHTQSVPCSRRNCWLWLVTSHQITGAVKPLCFLAEAKVRKGTVVSSHHPRAVSGLYWGYNVRLASCLSEYPQRFSAWALTPLLGLLAAHISFLEISCLKGSLHVQPAARWQSNFRAEMRYEPPQSLSRTLPCNLHSPLLQMAAQQQEMSWCPSLFP